MDETRIAKMVEQMLAFCVGAVLGVILGSFGMAMMATDQMESIKADDRQSVEYWRSEFFKLQDRGR